MLRRSEEYQKSVLDSLRQRTQNSFQELRHLLYSRLLSTGHNITTIPLVNITDCGIHDSGKGCVNQCTRQLQTIYVETVSVTSTPAEHHKVTALALAGSERFIKEILNRRDIVAMGCSSGVPMYADAVAVVEATVAMDRGDDRSTADRINETTKLMVF
jgi:hypothetical protein